MSETKHVPGEDARRLLLERVRAGHDALMTGLAIDHAPEFLEIGISMPQAKVLYLVSAEDGLHMSTLAARLHVTLSTISGLVERLVEHGLLTRRDDPIDRRQVVLSVTPEGRALIERFRELNERQLAALLDALDDDELDVVARAVESLLRAITSTGRSQRSPAGPAAASIARTREGDPS